MDPQQLDRWTRKLLSMHGVHYPGADIHWLYAPCTEGGRGLQQIESTYQSCIVGLDCYLCNSSDLFMQIVRKCEARRSYHSIRRMACQFTAQLQGSLSKDKSHKSHGSGTILCDGVFKQVPQTDAKHFRTCSGSLCVQHWGRKPMHRQYRRLTEKPPMDMKETYKWLKSSNLPAATEGLVIAAQDRALWALYYERNILHQAVSPTCRFYSVGLEAVNHIVAGCSALAPMDYTDRHTQVASIIHWDICHHFGVPVESRSYHHHPDRLVETDDIPMIWDTAIPTARKIGANGPDICFRNKKTNTCLLIWLSMTL